VTDLVGAPTSGGSLWILFLNADGTVKADRQIGNGKGEIRHLGRGAGASMAMA
jgi:hypothetical protein